MAILSAVPRVTSVLCHLSATRTRPLLGLFALLLPTISLAAEPSPGMELERTVESYQHRIVIEHYGRDDGLREIWLAPKNNPVDRVLLYEHGRHAEVFISPDQEYLVINDHAGSDIADVLLFKRRQGLSYSEIKQAKIYQKAWSFFARQNHSEKPPDYHHTYVEAVRWASNSRALLLSMWGHYDGENYLDPWYCVFDVKSLRFSIDLGLMNRDAFRSEAAKRRKAGAPKVAK